MSGWICRSNKLLKPEAPGLPQIISISRVLCHHFQIPETFGCPPAMSPLDFLYLLVVGFIRAVKWVELQFLKLFSTWLNRKFIEAGEELGIVLHFEDEGYQNWSVDDEKRALAKSKRYDALVHLRIHDKSVIVESINECNWGLGEGYVNEKWSYCKDEKDVAEALSRVLEYGMAERYMHFWNRFLNYLEYELFNLQTTSRATYVGEYHYDAGNDVYESFLDPWMQYSCGHWPNAENLDDAQVAKMELIAEKLKLKPGMRVLEIGCGWGMLCKYLAEKYGVSCVGVTISKEQVKWARKACEGLPVEIRFQDYRELDGSFDRIISVEMIEHVGPHNYKTFFQVALKNLKEDGLFFLQFSGVCHADMACSERWLATRMYPNACLPRAEEVIKASSCGFIIEELRNNGADFHKNLVQWRKNFNENWPALRKSGKYDDKFYRIWIYYLSFSGAPFRSKRVQNWIAVFSKRE